MTSHSNWVEHGSCPCAGGASRLASCSALGYAMAKMEEAVLHQSRDVAGLTHRRVPFVALILFGLIWLELINQLKAEWWLNPQYNYGLVVPLLALYLFWKRWQNRPAPAKPAARSL